MTINPYKMLGAMIDAGIDFKTLSKLTGVDAHSLSRITICGQTKIATAHKIVKALGIRGEDLVSPY